MVHHDFHSDDVDLYSHHIGDWRQCVRVFEQSVYILVLRDLQFISDEYVFSVGDIVFSIQDSIIVGSNDFLWSILSILCRSVTNDVSSLSVSFLLTFTLYFE